jgi:flagella basal body P-ring formation protein FlgA
MMPRGPKRSRRPGDALRLALVLLAPLVGVARADTPGDSCRARACLEQRPRAEVSEGSVSLRDVCAMSGTDADLLRRLRAVELGPSPEPGATSRLTRGALARSLAARGLGDHVGIVLAGSERTAVVRATQVIPGADLAARAVEALTRRLAELGLRGTAEATRSPADLRMPVGPVDFTARSLAAEELLARRVSVVIDVRQAGRLLRTARVGVEIKVAGPGMIANALLRAGSPLEGAPVEVREVQWTGLAALPAGSTRTQGLRLRRPVRSGDVVTVADVERAPPVARGEPVVVLARQGLVQLEGRAEALRDGGAGDLVPVRMAGSRGTLTARVMGPGTVEAVR